MATSTYTNAASKVSTSPDSLTVMDISLVIYSEVGVPNSGYLLVGHYGLQGFGLAEPSGRVHFWTEDHKALIGVRQVLELYHRLRAAQRCQYVDGGAG